MKSSSVASRPVVIDASFAVVAILPLPATSACQEKLAGWYNEGRTILAPDHWMVEAVSALRKLQFLKKLSSAELTRAVKDLFELDVETVPVDQSLCLAALGWSIRMTHAKAYDAFYVALAETLQAEFWTVDERLGNRVHQLGADWVRVSTAS